jgi:hypothetical protein
VGQELFRLFAGREAVEIHNDGAGFVARHNGKFFQLSLGSPPIIRIVDDKDDCTIRYEWSELKEPKANLSVTRLFTLRPGDWAAMEMWPGYAEPSVPYFSPVRIEGVEPLKTGQRQILIRFFNAAYAEGVQDFLVKTPSSRQNRNAPYRATNGP